MIKLAGLTLEATKVSPSSRLRYVEAQHVNFPLSYGKRIISLGYGEAYSVELFENVNFEAGIIEKLMKLLRLGESLKFDVEESPLLQLYDVVYLRSIDVDVVIGEFRRATLYLTQAYRDIMNDFESLNRLTSDGTLSLDSTNYKQGKNSVKVASGTYLEYELLFAWRGGVFSWLAFHFKPSASATFTIKVECDANNYATYDFSALAQIGAWKFIRIKLEDFTITGDAFSWDNVNKIRVSSSVAIDFNIDELCFID